MTMDFSNYTESLPMILFFLLLSLIIGTLAGESALYAFLLLVLASMVILNSSKLSGLLAKIY